MAGRTFQRHAFARVGLLGNPSDGYYGRTLSVTLRNFQATVTLEESPDLSIEPDTPDHEVFRNIEDLVESVHRRGYDGGARLVKAAIKTFADHCLSNDVALAPRNFTVRYSSSIPRQVGLAGSSAIVTATLRTLMAFFDLDIPRERQAHLVWSTETEELGITAGLQDRVAQVYEGLVYMDFAKRMVEECGHGAYESLDPQLLPTMFVAYRTEPASVSGHVHGDLRTRWERGDTDVHETLDGIAALAASGRDALLEGALAQFHSLMNTNFDLRRRIMHIDQADLTMVEAARALGASAKLTGSGGAIVGVYEGDAMMERVAQRLGMLGAPVIEAETR